MAPKLHPKIAEMRFAARANTVGFESGGMPKRMAGTKANSLDDYKSRFETMGLGSSSASAGSRTLQSNALSITQKAQNLGESAGCGGARVPLVADPGKTIGRMMDSFVNKKIERHQQASAVKKEAKEAKEVRKSLKQDKKKKKKKKHKKKDKKKKKKHKKKSKKDKKDKKKKKKQSSSSDSSSSSSSGSSSGEESSENEEPSAESESQGARDNVQKEDTLGCTRNGDDDKQVSQDGKDGKESEPEDSSRSSGEDDEACTSSKREKKRHVDKDADSGSDAPKHKKNEK